MIREARAVDRDAIVALLKEGFSRSRFADKGDVADKVAQDFILAMIYKHGVPALDGTHCMVGLDQGRIVGILFGAKQRVYHIGSKLQATDVFFYVQPGHPFLFAALLDSFTKWAWSDRRVLEIVQGNTDVIQDYRIAGRIYERMGFKKCGELWRREAA